MTKQITPEQAFSLSFTPFRYNSPVMENGEVVRGKDGKPIYELVGIPRFIKQGETQASALKRLRNHSLGRTKHKDLRQFPSFQLGVTSTATYVRQFEQMNDLVLSGSAAHLTHPAVMLNGPEVVFDIFAEDLV